MDLNALSLTELRRLATRIDTEIRRRNEAARRTFLKKMKKMATDEGLSLTEVIGEIAQTEKSQPAIGRKRKGKTGSKKPGAQGLKYHHPEKPGVGWSGRGRRPQWVLDWLAQGKPLEALEKPAGK
jgi:DNA-binding protein H-NS